MHEIAVQCNPSFQDLPEKLSAVGLGKRDGPWFWVHFLGNMNSVLHATGWYQGGILLG